MKLPETRAAIVKDLQDAMSFVGQAQERIRNRMKLFTELGKLYDDIDSFAESIKEGDYDYDINEGLE